MGKIDPSYWSISIKGRLHRGKWVSIFICSVSKSTAEVKYMYIGNNLCKSGPRLVNNLLNDARLILVLSLHFDMMETFGSLDCRPKVIIYQHSLH